jgi:hypothetical protein
MLYYRAQRDIDDGSAMRGRASDTRLSESAADVVALVPNRREWARCQTDFCALNVTVKEPLPAQRVVAPATRVSQATVAKNAREAATSVVMFVAVLVKLKRPTELSSH